MDVAGGGHSVRGRRRGRPPGVRSSRPASTAGSRRPAAPGAKRKARDISDDAEPGSTAGESSASDSPGGQENKHTAGARRGRPAAAAAAAAKKIATGDHSSHTAPAGLAAGGVLSVVDPRVFARRAAGAATRGGELAGALDAYLRSFVTMPDDSVVGGAGPEDVEAWVRAEAHTMHRVAALRLRGLLRDAEHHAAAADAESFSKSGLGPLLPPPRAPPPATATRPPGGAKPASSWDTLLRDVCQRQREVCAEGRRRRTEARKRARRAANAGELRMAQRGVFRRPEAAERAERERARKLAKWAVQQVMKRWAAVQGVAVDQRAADEEERRRRRGRQELLAMVERSTRLLAAQQEESADSGSESDNESEAGSEPESESDSDAEMAQLQRDQHVPMDALLEQYRAMQAGGGSGSGSEAGSEDGTLPDAATPSTARSPSPAAQSALLRGSLRPYQLEGVAWLLALHRRRTGGMLADEMGLGKTVQTIGFLGQLASAQGIWGPHLVVVPTSVLVNWQHEFHRWLPGFKVIAYYGSRSERRARRRGWSSPNAFHVCVTSYQLAVQDAAVLRRRPWHCLVLDEAQAIKNFRSQRWQALLAYRAAHRVLLTGTPLQNSLAELWALMHFLAPGDVDGSASFAELAQFREWFGQPLERAAALAIGGGGGGEEPQGAQAAEAATRLHAVLRPHVLRRLKRDVETQLPRKTEHVVVCGLSRRQRQLYDDFLARAQTRDTLMRGSYVGVMGCLMQLRKVCNHPDLFETRAVRTSWAVSAEPVAGYSAREQAVRRLLLLGNSRVLPPTGLAPVQHAPLALMAAESARRLDATPLLLRRGLQSARSALLDCAAAADRCWDALQMRPVRTTHYRSAAEHAAQQQQAARARRAAGWLRLARLNAARLPTDLLGAVHVCRRAAADQEAQRAERLRDLGLVLTARRRIGVGRPTVERFAFVTPGVVAVPCGPQALAAVHVHLRDSNLAQWGGDGWAREMHPSTLHMRQRVSRHTGLLRASEVRRQIAFPEPSLLQYDCGKLQALDRLVPRLVREGHRVLVFTQMTRMLDILERWMGLRGLRYLRLDGATPPEQRLRLTERFNGDARWSVFISSTRAGGLGINLTGADTVVFYDSDWNHAMDAQCQDRCHRIGQLREVHVYRLVSERTVEEAIWRRQKEKRWLSNVVMQDEKLEASEALPPSSSSAMRASDWYDLAGSMLDASDAGRSAKGMSEREAQRLMVAAEDDEADRAALSAAVAEARLADAVDRAEAGEPEETADEGPGGEGRSDAASDTRRGAGEDEREEEEEEEESAVGHIDDYMLRFVTDVLDAQEAGRES
ncbi:swr1 complex component [Coemansia erecta]|uniref:Swr1 complex component n=1 Tax=Coemansia erecta TaxID=147472 RepID=A0A9W7Y7Q7_9FUNG|nr:swr1 complex component [Coemansia erecta]